MRAYDDMKFFSDEMIEAATLDPDAAETFRSESELVRFTDPFYGDSVTFWVHPDGRRLFGEYLPE